MKKIVAAVLMLLMVFSLVACTGGAPAGEPSTEQSPAGGESSAPAETSAEADLPALATTATYTEGPWSAAYTDITADQLQEKLDTQLYVLCSVRFLSNPYFVTIDEGCQMFCEYLDTIGQKYSYECVTNEKNSDTQINQISAFLAKANGNGIIFCDPNENAITPTIAQMVTEAGCYIGTTWNKDTDVNVVDYSNWVFHTTINEQETMYEMSKAMFESFETPGTGTIFACQGLLGNAANSNRYAGLEKALAEYPNVKLLYTEDCGWSGDTALSTVETWLAATTDVDGIWCANDNMAIGAISALDSVGLKGKVKVVGYNGIEQAILDMIDGSMYGSVDCEGWMEGGYTLRICYDAWLGKLDISKLPESCRAFATNYTVVTADNAQEFYDSHYTNPVQLAWDDPWAAFRAGDYPVY